MAREILSQEVGLRSLLSETLYRRFRQIQALQDIRSPHLLHHSSIGKINLGQNTPEDEECRRCMSLKPLSGIETVLFKPHQDTQPPQQEVIVGILHRRTCRQEVLLTAVDMAPVE